MGKGDSSYLNEGQHIEIPFKKIFFTNYMAGQRSSIKLKTKYLLVKCKCSNEGPCHFPKEGDRIIVKCFDNF